MKRYQSPRRVSHRLGLGAWSQVAAMVQVIAANDRHPLGRWSPPKHDGGTGGISRRRDHLTGRSCGASSPLVGSGRTGINAAFGLGCILARQIGRTQFPRQFERKGDPVKHRGQQPGGEETDGWKARKQDMRPSTENVPRSSESFESSIGHLRGFC